MTDTSTILAAWARLLTAYREQRNAPPGGDFAATMRDLAKRADVAPVATVWTLDVQVAK